MVKRGEQEFGDCVTDRIDVSGTATSIGEDAGDEEVTARLFAEYAEDTRPQRAVPDFSESSSTRDTLEQRRDSFSPPHGREQQGPNDQPTVSQRAAPRPRKGEGALPSLTVCEEPDSAPQPLPETRTVRRLDPSWLRRLPRISSLDALWSGPEVSSRREILLALAIDATAAIAGALEVEVALESLYVTLKDNPIAGFRVTASHGEGLGLSETRLCPALTSALLSALTKAPVAPLATHPDPVSGAVLGHGALVICKTLGDCGLARPRLLTSTTVSTSMCIELGLRVERSLCHAQIGLDETAARALARCLDRDRSTNHEPPHSSSRPDQSRPAKSLEPTNISESLASVQVEARLCMGPMRLPASTIESLQPGDALCPAPAARIAGGLPEGPAHLFATSKKGTYAAIGRIDGHSFSIERLGRVRPTSEEPTMKPVSKSPASLAIDVHVVLETIPMTIAELARIGPGSVLALAGPCPRVKLQAGEETIAIGELVDVDGTLGVRIIEGASR